MAKLLRSGQVFYSRLLGINFPGVQVKDDRTALFVDFPHAKTGVCVGKQPEIAAAAEGEAPAVHFQHAHRKLVKLVGNLVGNQWSIGNAVVRMKTNREN